MIKKLNDRLVRRNILHEWSRSWMIKYFAEIGRFEREREKERKKEEREEKRRGEDR